MEEPRRAAVRQALSVGIATGLYGVSLGALAVADGLSVPQACATSLLLFSGGSQFALVGVLGSGGSVGAAVAASSLLGVRNAMYGLQLAPLLEHRGWRRFAAAQLTIDESTAVAVAQPPSARAVGFWVTGLAIFVFWNLTTLAGALLGDALGDPRRDDGLLVTTGGTTASVIVRHDGLTTWLHTGGTSYAVTQMARERSLKGGAAASGEVRSPMPGLVVAVPGTAGAEVTKGTPIAVVEAMKMEHTLVAPFDGTLATLTVRTGDQVVVDQLLFTVTPQEA